MNVLGVLIADPSPSVRAVLRRIVEELPELRVVGEARTGREVLDLALELRPDTIIMDVDLPELDGVTATDRISESLQVPIVIVTSGVDRDRLVATFGTLRRGVVGIFAKPTVPEEWEELGDTLRQTLQHITRHRGQTRLDDLQTPGIDRQPIRFVVVGASTGGPSALFEMLQELGPTFPASVAVVQHIASGFEAALAGWLASETALDICVAEDGEVISPGRVRLAPAGSHLTLEPAGRFRLDSVTPPCNGHRPAADVLFRSLLGATAPRTAAVLLSGMGSDGVSGMLQLREAGAVTVAQDEPSSVVWGMPRVAVERHAAGLVLPPVAIGRYLREAARGSDG